MIPKSKHTKIMVLIGLLIFSWALVDSKPSNFNGMLVKSKLSVNSCLDNDGKNIYVKGLVNYGDSLFYDTCFNGVKEDHIGQYVIENYCYHNNHYQEIKYCNDGCLNGKCS